VRNEAPGRGAGVIFREAITCSGLLRSARNDGAFAIFVYCTTKKVILQIIPDVIAPTIKQLNIGQSGEDFFRQARRRVPLILAVSTGSANEA
jgi:hypothetical protein